MATTVQLDKGMAMARTKDPQLEEVRQRQVTSEVITALEEGSWRSMTLSGIAKRAGVSKGVVTYWFPTKNDLILAAIRRYHADWEKKLTAVASEPGGARELLTRLIDAAFPNRDEVVREIRFQAEVWSFAKENPAALAEVQNSYEQFRLACGALLSLGQLEGYVTTENPSALYPFVHALLDGLSIQVAYDAELDIPTMRRQLVHLLEVWFTAKSI